MNYLGHSLVSHVRQDEAIVCVGNLLGDALGRVRPRLDPSDSVFGPGLNLHREIDRFCDSHPLTKKCLEHLQRHLPRGASIVMDIAYDHFLLADLGDGADEVVRYAHDSIVSHLSTLPSPSDMVARDILVNSRLAANRTLDGVRDTLQRIIRRRPRLPIDPARAVEAIHAEYAALDDLSREFFHHLQRHFQKETSHPSI